MMPPAFLAQGAADGKSLANPVAHGVVTRRAHLVGSPGTPEYHLGNIYAKCGVQGRQQLRRLIEQQRLPAAA